MQFFVLCLCFPLYPGISRIASKLAPGGVFQFIRIQGEKRCLQERSLTCRRFYIKIIVKQIQTIIYWKRKRLIRIIAGIVLIWLSVV